MYALTMSTIVCLTTGIISSLGISSIILPSVKKPSKRKPKTSLYSDKNIADRILSCVLKPPWIGAIIPLSFNT